MFGVAALNGLAVSALGLVVVSCFGANRLAALIGLAASALPVLSCFGANRLGAFNELAASALAALSCFGANRLGVLNGLAASALAAASCFGANRLGPSRAAGCPKGDLKGCVTGLSAAPARDAEVDEAPCRLNKLADVMEGNADTPVVAGFAPGFASGADGIRKLKVDFFSLVSAGLGWPNAGIDEVGSPKGEGLLRDVPLLGFPNIEEFDCPSAVPAAALADPKGDADMKPAVVVLPELSAAVLLVF